jgi:hypothetical protein
MNIRSEGQTIRTLGREFLAQFLARGQKDVGAETYQRNPFKRLEFLASGRLCGSEAVLRGRHEDIQEKRMPFREYQPLR